MKKTYMNPELNMFFSKMDHDLLIDTKMPAKPEDSDEVDQEEAEIKLGRYGNLWEEPDIQFDDRPESLW